MRSLNLGLFTHSIRGYPDITFQEENLPSMRLRAWTYPKCAYQLPRMTRGRRCMRRWGSLCWGMGSLNESAERHIIRQQVLKKEMYGKEGTDPCIVWFSHALLKN